MYNTDKFDRMTLDEKHEFFMESYGKLRKLGVIRKWYEFAELLDVSANSISGAKNKNPDYLTSSLLAKVDDALSSYGDQSITITHSPHTNVATGHGQIAIGSAQEDVPIPDEDMIPVIPMKLYKEADVNILEYVQDEGNDVQMTPAIQQFPKTDCIYSVQTMAMYPHLHQGDLIALKAIPKDKPIVNGEMYAVDTKDLGILVRFAYDRGDRIELRNSDEAKRFEPFFLSKADIYTIFRVVGMIRTNI